MSNNKSLLLASASSQYAYHNDSVPLSITGNLTLSSWVKYTSIVAGENTLIGKYYTTSNRSYLSMYNQTGGGYQFYNSPDGAATNQGNDVGFVPTTAKWYFVAFVYDTGGNVKFYRGDQSTLPTLTNTATGMGGSMFDSAGNFALGAYNTDGTPQSFLNGKLFDVRVWNTNRSLANLQADYITNLVGNEANLSANWLLNGDYTDKTSNAMTLTPINSPVFSPDVPYGKIKGSILMNLL